MGRENFRRSGVEPPGTAVDGSPSAPPAAGGGAKAAAAAPTGYGSGSMYGNNAATAYEEPAAIKAARTNAGAYTADASNDEPPPAYGSEPAYGSASAHQSAYSNDNQSAYSNDGDQQV